MAKPSSLLMRLLLIGAAAPVLIAAPASAQQTSSGMNLPVGQGRLVTLPRAMSDVFVANPAVADVQVRSTRQIYIYGKGQGETNIHVVDGRGAVIFSSMISVSGGSGNISQMLALAMPDARIVATHVGGMVLLTGEVARSEDVAEAQKLVETMSGLKVVSRLQTSTPQQVNLQVRVAEVNRTLVKDIGANLIGQGNGFSMFTGPSGGLDTDENGRFNGGFKKLTDGSAFSLGKRLLGLNLSAKLDLAEQQGLAVTLAQPNLTTLSGEPADFLAGGEYPIPVPSSGNSNAITITYKRYGVSLQYTPTVLSSGRISMHVRPEVSDITSEGAVRINGISVPALTVRRTETTVELGSGESFMIAGLLSNRSIDSVIKTPGIGDVPVLGALFKSDNFRRGETELVIVITPYLVKPVNAADIRLPTDGYQVSSDLERVLLNQNHRPDSATRPAAAPNGAQRSEKTPPAPGFDF